MGGIGIGMAFKQPTPASGGGGDSWWLSGGVSAENCIAAYQAKGAASYAASKVNLANPGTHDLTQDDHPPTWDTSNGWLFPSNETATLRSHLDANITSNDINREASSAIVRFSDADNLGVSPTVYLLGASNVNDFDSLAWYIQHYVGTGEGLDTSTTFFANHSVATGGSEGSYVAGVLLIEGIAAMAGTNCYFNGADTLATINNLWDAGLSFSTIGIGVAHYYAFDIYDHDQNPSGQTDFKIQAVAIYNTALTAEQVAAITTAMQAL